jgi:hypothetical protein
MVFVRLIPTYYHVTVMYLFIFLTFQQQAYADAQESLILLGYRN